MLRPCYGSTLAHNVYGTISLQPSKIGKIRGQYFKELNRKALTNLKSLEVSRRNVVLRKLRSRNRLGSWHRHVDRGPHKTITSDSVATLSPFFSSFRSSFIDNPIVQARTRAFVVLVPRLIEFLTVA